MHFCNVRGKYSAHDLRVFSQFKAFAIMQTIQLLNVLTALRRSFEEKPLTTSFWYSSKQCRIELSLNLKGIEFIFQSTIIFLMEILYNIKVNGCSGAGKISGSILAYKTFPMNSEDLHM